MGTDIEIRTETEILCARYTVRIEIIRKYFTELVSDLGLEGSVGVSI